MFRPLISEFWTFKSNMRKKCFVFKNYACLPSFLQQKLPTPDLRRKTLDKKKIKQQNQPKKEISVIDQISLFDVALSNNYRLFIEI